VSLLVEYINKKTKKGREKVIPAIFPLKLFSRARVVSFLAYVAMPLALAIRFKAVLSPIRMLRTGPVTSATFYRSDN